MGATFVKKNLCLVARLVSFDTAGLHLHFPYFEPYPSKYVELDLSHDILTLIMLLQYTPIKSYLNQSFQASRLLKYDSNIVITLRFFKAMSRWKCKHLQNVSYEA